MSVTVSDKYDIVIGLEVHCQLKTNSKLFCGCANHFGDEPNDNTCPVCLGMPGTLPVLNSQAFDYAILVAMAIGADIAETTKFDRKHYFYPDLPKGYQISQYDEPYCENGGVTIDLEDGSTKFIKLTRIHMEEDAGKLSHAEDSHIRDSIVDLNRAGTPLLEIVTDPVITSPEEAGAYLTELKQILEYLDVSDCNMQEGSLRCDANISLKPKGATELGTKVEIKNMNSFKGVTAAIEHEILRQFYDIENGIKIIQQTRLFDVDTGESKSMRTKEDADDYRYFPEPDLPRYAVDQVWRDEIAKNLVELPRVKRERFAKEFELPEYNVSMLTAQREIADYFETCSKQVKNVRELSNWMMGEVQRELSERKIGIDTFEISTDQLSGLINCIDGGIISKKIAKDNVFPELIKSEESAAQIVDRLGLKVESDDSVLVPIIQEAIEKNPKAVEDVKNGKKKAIGALVGFCMKATKGKADPATLSALIESQIKG